VKSIVQIDLPRPRLPPAELAVTAEYQKLFSRIWGDIKDEVSTFG
jgi:hypothetical protein